MSEKYTKPLILVDGSSYLFRAYHALPPLTNSKGMPTGAVYGVINMLRKLIKDYSPDYMAVIFDPKGKTFRHDMYDQYKANRAVMPDELQVQIKPLHDVIRALGIPLIVVDGVEADDVIGTLALQAKQHLPVLISTGDKDLAQLVDPQVTLINTMNDKLLDVDGVQTKFGVGPSQIIDYLALMGDTSDNVPGIPKVGPKTAAKWLAEYKSLDELVKHADEIKGKVGENLRAHLDELALSRKLVTIKCDLPIDFATEQLKLQASEPDELIKLFTELEFRRWLDQVKSDNKADELTREYETILDEETFKRWLGELKKAKYFAFDTETTDLNALRAELVGLSFSVKPGQAAYVPLAHDYMGAPKQLDKNWVLEQLCPLLENPECIIVGQNLKYDYEVLKNCGVTITASMWDTMLESYVLNSTTMRHDMDSLAMKYLGESTVKFEEIAGKGAKQLRFNEIDLAQASPYAAEDADITLRLHEHLLPQIKAEPSLERVLTEIEWPLMPVLARMECNGVLIDAKMLQKQSQVLTKRISEIEQDVYQLSGCEFNLGSPKQLQKILYEDMQLPIIKKTPKGQPSTAENVLQELAMDHDLPKLILEFRSLSKLKSTYTDALPQQINPRTGRVHTSYNQAVTATGRLSSTEPNLQNIPVRTELGRDIRKAFIAPEGCVILAADYSQVELRIMAHLSQDPTLLKAFSNNHDVHAATASEVFGVTLEDVTPDQRRHAKAVNFGLMYGMSAFGLAQQLNVGRHVAQEYIDIYFARYPKVHEYMEQAREVAAKQGYVETLFGRRVHTPEINASNRMRRLGAERAAINAPLQGTAADIIKLAMIKIDDWLQTSETSIKMIMQVHDELVFEVPEGQLDLAKEKIRGYMENTAELSVPLIVQIGVGENWDQAH